MASEAEKAIEAILMVAQEPVDPHLLAQVLEVSLGRVEELCAELAAGYEAQDRGFVLAHVAGGYRFQSHGHLAPYVERFVLEGQSARLSAAALETLAIVAYKQPMSRAQVAAIRGVNVDGVMRTLQQRGYIEEVGRDPGPGQATLFGTSNEFLERLGLARIEDLPPIADLFPSADIMEALEKGLRADRLEPLPLDLTDPAPPAPASAPAPAPGPGEDVPFEVVEPAPVAVELDDAEPEPEPVAEAATGPSAPSADHWSDDPDAEVEPLPEPDFMTDVSHDEPEADLARDDPGPTGPNGDDPGPEPEAAPDPGPPATHR